MRAPALSWLTLLAALVAPSGARADEVATTAAAEEIETTWISAVSRSVYQGYQVRLFPQTDNATTRNLNRIYTTLDLGGYGINSGDIDVVLSVRYDTDFGTGFHRDTPPGAGIPAVDGRDDLDLMYMYVDWRNIVPGLLDGRLGRQLLIDDLTWYSIDGLKLTGHLWHDGSDGLDLEVYAGLPVRIDLLFSSDPFLLDGTEIDDAGSMFGGFAFGANAQLKALDALTASLAYRQELEFRGDAPVDFRANQAGLASGGLIGLEESRIGGSLGYTIRPINVDLYTHGTWDLLVGALDQARAGAAFSPAKWGVFRAEYLRVRPQFAGDSIFNYFNIFPYDRGRADVSIEILEGLTVDAGYLLSAFNSQDQGAELSHGPSAAVRYRHDNYSFGGAFESATNTGGAYAYGGNYRLLDLFGDISFLEGRYGANAHVYVNTTQNDWFEGADAGQVATPHTSFVTTLGARGQFNDFIGARVMFAKNFDSVMEGSYRVYSELVLRY